MFLKMKLQYGWWKRPWKSPWKSLKNRKFLVAILFLLVSFFWIFTAVKIKIVCRSYFEVTVSINRQYTLFNLSSETNSDIFYVSEYIYNWQLILSPCTIQQQSLCHVASTWMKLSAENATTSYWNKEISVSFHFKLNRWYHYLNYFVNWQCKLFLNNCSEQF